MSKSFKSYLDTINLDVFQLILSLGILFFAIMIYRKFNNSNTTLSSENDKKNQKKSINKSQRSKQPSSQKGQTKQDKVIRKKWNK